MGPYGTVGDQQGWESWSYGTVVDWPETRQGEMISWTGLLDWIGLLAACTFANGVLLSPGPCFLYSSFA